MVAIILAAGRGTKIWPYGVTKNKSVIPIANKPIILHLVEALKKAGCNDIAVVTGYRQEQISHAVADPGVKVIVQKEPKGTAEALLTALKSIDAEQFIVIYGDVLVSERDLTQLLEQYKSAKTNFAALVDSLKRENPSDWLCAQVRDNRIEYILGHPRDDVTHRLCGVYALNRSIVPYLERNPGIMTHVQVGMMPPSEAELAESLQLAIDDGEEVLAVEVRDCFIDVDKPWHILEANTTVLEFWAKHPASNLIAPTAKVSEAAEITGPIVVGENSIIGPGVKVKGPLWIGKNTRIEDGPLIEPNVVIGNDCHTSRYCQIGPNTSIGDHCKIGHCAEIEGVLMDRVFLVHYGEYWGVIGSGTDLAAATVCGNLRFDDAQSLHRVKGRRELPRTGANAVYLGDYVRTGVGAILMPGVKVGPYSIIGAGTLVSEDVPEHTLIYAEQTLVKKSWGPEKYGW